MNLPDDLRARLEQGPLLLADYMALSNAHYYATRDPLGARGDFITAPEVSQMFGELIGLWLADSWQRMGAPARVYIVELGPGRGTLLADAWRATRMIKGFHAAAQRHLVETSPPLRAAQKTKLGAVIHHDTIASLPRDAPLLVIANEFFDCLPVQHYVRNANHWHARTLYLEKDHLHWGLDREDHRALIPQALQNADLVELCQPARDIARQLGARLATQGGVGLWIDYGYQGPLAGETLQALRGHEKVDVRAYPADADLTAHVDFAALAEAARAGGARVAPLMLQGAWLHAMGIDLRTETLKAQATPAQAAALEAQRVRLCAPQQMGQLFKVLMLAGRDWQPALFEESPTA